MLPYYLIFIFLVVCCYSCFIRSSKDFRGGLFVCTFIILVLFSGLRFFPTQQDFSAYSRTFSEVCKYGISIDTYFEPGYVLLMYIVSFFTDSTTMWFVILAGIGVGLNFSSIKKYGGFFLFLPIICYFSHTFIMREMGAVRAGVAAGICFFSIRYIEKRKFMSSLMCVLIAMCFHLSAIVYSLFYPLYWLKLSKFKMYVILVICMIIGLFSPLGHLLIYVPIVGESSQIIGYSKDIGSSLGVFSNLNTVKQLLFVLIGLQYYDFLIMKRRCYRLFLFGSFISVCWLMVWNDFPIIAGRFAMYFSITEILFIPSLLYLLKPSSRPIGCLFIIILAFLQLYLNGQTFLTPASGYYPYRVSLL